MVDHRSGRHAAHDPLLVAAYAAGDATGPSLARAAGLVADCVSCALLHRDLRALRRALATAPAPARPRDFRITAEAAAALDRPSSWHRLRATVTGARGAGPLAASMAVLGVAGLLMGGALNLQPAGRAEFGAAASAASSQTVIDTNAGAGTLPPSRPEAAPSAAASAAPSYVGDPSPGPGEIDEATAEAITRAAVEPEAASLPLFATEFRTFDSLGLAGDPFAKASPRPTHWVWVITLGRLDDTHGGGWACTVDATSRAVLRCVVWSEVRDHSGAPTSS